MENEFKAAVNGEEIVTIDIDAYGAAVQVGKRIMSREEAIEKFDTLVQDYMEHPRAYVGITAESKKAFVRIAGYRERYYKRIDIDRYDWEFAPFSSGDVITILYPTSSGE